MPRRSGSTTTRRGSATRSSWSTSGTATRRRVRRGAASTCRRSSGTTPSSGVSPWPRATRDPVAWGAIFTEILPADAFYLAEDYHQKYMLRRSPELMADFAAMYPDAEGFVASTAAARVNGYLGGWGTAVALAAEIESFGLSAKARRILERGVARR